METVNHEYYVSPEVANLLEKAGFDWACKKCYNNGVLFNMEADEIRAQVPQHSSYDVLAPTLEVAQRWLREEKNYEVFVVVKFLANKEYIARVETNISGYSTDIYKFYEEAQEAGIKKALEIILEKGE